eukprot:m.269233 g.269233  ORF g.269233 m.269233 type:complete len:293 (-) comp54735_c0_seq30:70-948(-)
MEEDWGWASVYVTLPFTTSAIAATHSAFAEWGVPTMFAPAAVYIGVWSVYYPFLLACITALQLLLNPQPSSPHAWLHDAKKRKRVAQMVHTYTYVLLTVSANALNLAENWNASYFDRNRPEHLWIFDVSIAYFLVDTVIDHFSGYFDVMFLVHHVVCLANLFVARYALDRTANLMLLGLGVGELTNIMQQPWNAARELKYTRVYDRLSLPFTVYYVLVRVICAPTILISTIKEAYFSSTAPPVAGWVTPAYIVFESFILYGSFVWSYKLVQGYRKHRSKGKDATKETKQKEQ